MDINVVCYNKLQFTIIYLAVEKAVLYLDKDELPPHWDRDLLFGVDKNCITTDSEGVNDSDVSLYNYTIGTLHKCEITTRSWFSLMSKLTLNKILN